LAEGGLHRWWWFDREVGQAGKRRAATPRLSATFAAKRP
jgi:hypothetical protein